MVNQAIKKEKQRQDPDNRRDAILKAALEVFATRGFNEASNAEIAKAAGLRSAGLLTYYYPKKLDLLFAVITRFSPAFQLIDGADRLWELPPADVIRIFAGTYLQMFSLPESAALMRIVLGEALRSPEVASKVQQFGPERLLGFLRTYFQHQIELGSLRKCDPDLAARCVMGPLFTYVMQRVVLGVSFPEAATRERLIEELVTGFERGFGQ